MCFSQFIFIHIALYRSVIHCHCFSFDSMSLHCLQGYTSVLLILHLYLMFSFDLLDLSVLHSKLHFAFYLHYHMGAIVFYVFCVHLFFTWAGMCFMHLYHITHRCYKSKFEITVHRVVLVYLSSVCMDL